ACPYWIGTTSDALANWNYTSSQLNTLLSQYNTYYTLLARSVDVAGNLQTTFNAGVSSMTFLFDSQPPRVGISYPVDGNSYRGSVVSGGGAARIRGTANDDQNAPYTSGMRGVSIRLSYILSGDTWYWLGANFSSGTVANNGYIPSANLNWD